MDMVDIYRQSLDNVGRLVGGVKQDQLTGSTPCAEFNCRDLLNHMIGGNYMMATLAQGGTMDPSADPGDLAGDDPKAAFDQSAKAVLDAISAPGALDKSWKFPFGEMPAQQGMGIAIMEAVVHGWDLAKATGQDTTIDPQVAEMILAGMKMMAGGGPRESGGPFAAEVSIDESAPVVDRMLAFLGRTP